jgi:S-(hydroxymethyl)glutathione dehydrogenase / alcohol dehydrogenase
VQGARIADAKQVIAVDPSPAKLELAATLGATAGINPQQEDAIAAIKRLTGGRGADVVIEAAGTEAAFRLSVEAVRPAGQVVWLGKVNVNRDVSFRWGSLMGEKRIVRSSYGGARPKRDFPMLADRRIALEDINDGFAALKRGDVIRSVITFGP